MVAWLAGRASRAYDGLVQPSQRASPDLWPVGAPVSQGAYVLRIDVAAPVEVAFGRFAAGRSVHVPPGTCAYVGSAMGAGAAPVLRRIARHARRAGGCAPHPLWAPVEAWLRTAECARPTRAPRKALRWHVDYLLESPEVALTGAIVAHSPHRCEDALARWIAECGDAAALAPGLGASDRRAEAHLFTAPADRSWWTALAAAADRLALGGRG